MLQHFVEPDTAFSEWAALYDQLSRARACVALAMPADSAEAAHDLDVAWERIGAHERATIGTRWPGMQGALVKLRMALAHVRGAEQTLGDVDLDQNWRLVASAILDLVPQVDFRGMLTSPAPAAPGPEGS